MLTKQFNELDRRYGSKVRQQMWKNDEHTQTSVNTADEKENEMITEIEQAIMLDESVIDMVYTEYLISYPTYGSSTSPANDVNVESSIWEIISSSLDIFTQLTVPRPLTDDGNFPRMPEGCQ